MKRILPLFLNVLLFLPSLACGSFTPNYIAGSGKIVTKTFDVSGFDRVILEGFGDVYVEQGQNEGLSIETDDNIFSALDIRVTGNELRLGTKPGFDPNPSESITYNLAVKDLNRVSLSGSGNFYVEPLKSNDLAISISGSGNINIDGLNVDNLSIDLNGSGDITLADINAEKVDAALRGSGNIKLDGNIGAQNITVTGSGNYLAGDLQSDTADVRVPGSGDVTIWVNDNLNVNINGSGDIQYYGKPSVDQNISGSGSVTSLGEK